MTEENDSITPPEEREGVQGASVAVGASVGPMGEQEAEKTVLEPEVVDVETDTFTEYTNEDKVIYERQGDKEEKRPFHGKSGCDDEHLERLIVQCNGYRSQIAAKLGVTARAISKRINKNPRLKEVDETVRQQIQDMAENELVKAIKNHEPWAICFYLKTKGGYLEKKHFEIGIEEAPPLTFVLPSARSIEEAHRAKIEIGNIEE